MQELGSSKLGKLCYILYIEIVKQSVELTLDMKKNDNCVNKAVRHFKVKHSQCISLEYLNNNSAWNSFFSISPLLGHNTDIVAKAEAKLDS